MGVLTGVQVVLNGAVDYVVQAPVNGVIDVVQFFVRLIPGIGSILG